MGGDGSGRPPGVKGIVNSFKPKVEFGGVPENIVLPNYSGVQAAALRTAPAIGGGGDVTGPAAAVDSNFAGFNGITGKIIKDSGSKAADFEAAGTSATHSALTTGVHGVGAGTVAEVADIATDANLSVAAQAVVTAGACDTDANLSAAAQDAISKKHTQGTDQGLDTGGANAVTAANCKTAYDHSQDNTQAHSDYLLNDQSDSMNGALTATGFTIGANALDTNEWAALDGIHSAWTSFTPAWNNVTEGNGTNVGYYKQIGKTVFVRAYFVMGNTSSVTGAISLTLPVEAINYGQGCPTGGIRMVDTSDGLKNYWGNVSATGASAYLTTFKCDATYPYAYSAINATVPFTWDNTDIWSLQIIYEAA